MFCKHAWSAEDVRDIWLNISQMILEDRSALHVRRVEEGRLPKKRGRVEVVMPQDFDAIKIPLFRRLEQCIRSSHFQVQPLLERPIFQAVFQVFSFNISKHVINILLNTKSSMIMNITPFKIPRALLEDLQNS